jgi:hypothetical protein
MPEICRFYGIVIKMYFADHSPSHEIGSVAPRLIAKPSASHENLRPA